MCTSAATKTDRPLPLAAIVSCHPDLTGFCDLVDFKFNDVAGTGSMYVCMYDVGCMVVKMRFKGFRDSEGNVCAMPSDVHFLCVVQDIVPELFDYLQD